MVRKVINKAKSVLTTDLLRESEKQKLLLGKILTNQIVEKKEIKSLEEVEFSIFSQFGDDGIIQWLVHHLNIEHKTFIEFGVEDYSESNTRFLMMNNNWSGFVMDGDPENIKRLEAQYYYWKYDLTSKAIFINKHNINTLIAEQNFTQDVGLLHIDLDGNDYYIWEAIEVVTPAIVIVEYNSLFGSERPISIKYDDAFIRTNAHYSNLFWGSSIKSLYNLAIKKGYSFIGCNSGGNNAYFIRNDKLNDTVRPVTLKDGYVESKYRESRDENGRLTFLSKQQARELLKDLMVYNTELNKEEKFNEA